MLTINLNKLILQGFHGIHEEEKLLGNTFEVNVSMLIESDEPINKLEQTIDYASIYSIIKTRMAIATPLLETWVQDLAQDIYLHDKKVKTITISIEKKNAPLYQIEGSVSVTYTKHF